MTAVTEHTPDDPHAAGHYAAIADLYEQLWEHSVRFRTWMVNRIVESVELPRGGVILDVGGGTGIYAAELATRHPDHHVVVADPSAEMLEHVPPAGNVSVLHASAEQTSEAARALGHENVDLILIKEAVHHFADAPTTLASLSTLLQAGGSILVVMLPKRIDYPLFAAALERFTDRQPDPKDIEASMAACGLRTSRTVHSYDLTMSTTQWLSMVENRFMSLLSTFSDAELAAGLHELRDVLPPDVVAFADTFEFIVGTAPG